MNFFLNTLMSSGNFIYSTKPFDLLFSISFNTYIHFNTYKLFTNNVSNFSSICLRLTFRSHRIIIRFKAEVCSVRSNNRYFFDQLAEGNKWRKSSMNQDTNYKPICFYNSYFLTSSLSLNILKLHTNECCYSLNE